MEREILFRVWNGQEMEYNVMVGKFGVFYVNPSNDGIDENDSASLSTFNTKYTDDVPVMQYTGLKDKNGKKIFEGDIIDYKQALFNVKEANWTRKRKVVKFDALNARWNIYETMAGEFDIHVIGNMYESPELLNNEN